MAPSARFQRIVVAVARQEDEAEAVPLVLDLAQAFASEVLVVHVRVRMVTGAVTAERETIPESIELAERVGRRLMDAGIRASVDVHGATPKRVADEILVAARNFDADLIVIGPHHTHGIYQHVVGDIGHALAHGSSCPVLLMPVAKARA